ncbi:SpoIIE family protein phosphatase [Streptomyces sp. NPDC006134]|uniref:PP2C family protein-serine/threonine phosphatase n=1 Tax=Streptomyces sp. NPDC006134 TaxID=3154467 RepID=UPI00340440DF
MPSPLSADRPSAQPPGRGSVETLISQARRLKGDVDAVRRGVRHDGSGPRGRWQRALYDLALHQLDDLDEHLAQLRDGPLPAPPPAEAASPAPAGPGSGSLLSRVGSAEWNLLTDAAEWSGELYRILGRDPSAPPLTLDELPSLVLDEDRPKLTAMVTGCLVDGRPIDGEFRIVHPGGAVRTVHMMGEPVLDADGSTASMWAVLRDVSELRRSQRVVSETRDSLRRDVRHTQPGHRAAVEPQEAGPPRHGSLRLPRRGGPGMDIATGYVPSSADTPGGAWCDALPLAGGETLLGAGDLTWPGTGTGPAVGTAMLLGALRGMTLAGTGPARLLALLGELLDTAAPPAALTGAVCCHYRPGTRTLAWARTGHPAPLLFRAGTGRRLIAPGTAPGQAEETLEAGDVLVLHTGGPGPRDGTGAAGPLLALAPRLTAARTAEDALRTVVAECGGPGHEDGACLLVARVTP